MRSAMLLLVLWLCLPACSSQSEANDPGDGQGGSGSAGKPSAGSGGAGQGGGSPSGGAAGATAGAGGSGGFAGTGGSGGFAGTGGSGGFAGTGGSGGSSGTGGSGGSSGTGGAGAGGAGAAGQGGGGQGGDAGQSGGAGSSGSAGSAGGAVSCAGDASGYFPPTGYTAGGGQPLASVWAPNPISSELKKFAAFGTVYLSYPFTDADMPKANETLTFLGDTSNTGGAAPADFRYVTISTCPGDLRPHDPTSPEPTLALGCRRGANEGPFMHAVFTPTPMPNDNVCELAPGVTYYLNIIMENPEGGFDPNASPQCLVKACGFRMGII